MIHISTEQFKFITMDEQVVKQFATTLSSLTILSCLFLKVPQILQIREKRSAKGICIRGMVVEIIGYTIMTLYNAMNEYSVMTYLEYPIIVVQLYVLCFYVLMYRGYLGEQVIIMAFFAYFTFVTAFVIGALPKTLLSYLVPFCTPMSGFAKASYIHGIIKVGNADAVSLTTWLISVATNLARVFTVYVDSADARLLINFIVSTCMSAGVLGTAFYYQNYKPKSRSRRRRKSNAKKQHVD